jgi:hypothetical protein
MRILVVLFLFFNLISCASVDQKPCGSVGMPGFDWGYDKDEHGISTYWGPNNIHCAPAEVQRKAKKYHPDWFKKS